MVAGFLLAFFVPGTHRLFPFLPPAQHPGPGMRESALGMVIGAALVYGILRAGKLLFGRYKLQLEPRSRIVFTESSLQLPAQNIPYEDIFYRSSDTIRLQAERVELVDRCYSQVEVRLKLKLLRLFGMAGRRVLPGLQLGHRVHCRRHAHSDAQAGLVQPSALRPLYRAGGGDLDLWRLGLGSRNPLKALRGCRIARAAATRDRPAPAPPSPPPSAPPAAARTDRAGLAP